MHIRSRFLLILLTLVMFASVGLSQVTLTALNTAYTQTFDGLGTSSATWTDNSTLAGWYAVVTAKTSPYTLTAGDGSSNAGALYSFGTSGASDRALGALGSGSTGTIYYGVRLKNSTGQTITALTISYTGEQWRNSGSTSTQDLTVSYQAGSSVTSVTSGTWTSVPALTFYAPIYGGTAGSLDGNATANRATLSTTIGVTINAGEEIMIRWVEIDHSGSDHGLSTDDLSITPLSPTLTQYYCKSSGNLNLLSSWGTNTDGSGTVPTSFTADYQVFNVTNASSATIGAAWTVSGLLSKVVVGNGSTSVSFTVPAAYSFVGPVDVTTNASLILQNSVVPTLGTLATGSTVSYGQSTPDTVVAMNYANLTLSGSTKVFGAGATTVSGNLLVSGATINGVGSPFSTVNLYGDFTLQSSAAFDTSLANRFTLNCLGSSAQVLQGNGSDFRLFKVVLNNASGLSLSTSGGTSNLVLGNTSGGGVDLVAGALTVNSNTITVVKGYTFVSGTSGTFTASSSSNFVFNQDSAASSSFGTIKFTPGYETINNLTVNLPAPKRIGVLKLGTNCVVGGTLTLTAGTIQTNGDTLTASGSVVRTAGKVYGAFRKPITAGTTSKTFELGDTLAYAPVTLTFGSVTTGGTLVASTTRGIHPSLVTSGIDTTKRLDRYFSIGSAGTVFTSCTATFNFSSDDVLSGATPTNFVVKRYNSAAWNSVTTANAAATSIQGTGITAFGDFAMGEASSSGTTSITAAMTSGWNLVSIPCTPSVATPASLFPGAISGTVNGFLSGSYATPTAMNVGEGYWAFYGAAASNTISGSTVTTASVVVPTGNRWVLIGSISASAAASNLTSSVSGSIVSGTLNGWNGVSYSTPSTFEPMKGYWVFVTSPCTLTIH